MGISNLIIIDNKSIDVPVVKLEVVADYLWKEETTGRLEDGSFAGELMGTFLNYYIEFGYDIYNPQEHDRLWDILSKPTPNGIHKLKVPLTSSGFYEYHCYFSNIKKGLEGYHDGICYFGNITGNFIAQKPAYIP